MIEVVSVNVSIRKGTSKTPTGAIVIDGRGVAGDAHAGAGHRQVSLLALESINRFAADAGRPFAPGEFAENITTRGLDTARLAVFDRIRIGPVELEATQIGKTCHGEGCAIFREVGKCVMPMEGVFFRALSGGTVRPGDRIEFDPRQLRFLVITLSDRASQGEYEDLSGPRIQELAATALRGARWRPEFTREILPDRADLLRAALDRARAGSVDVIFTTGGTGAGPRDIAPETVSGFCDKLVPGIMESIRLKYAAGNPRALLSRAVAGVAGGTVVFTLPGSVRAVEEYMAEILPLWEHLLLMARGIGH
jgi:molybdopterin adenylyltransferase